MSTNASVTGRGATVVLCRGDQASRTSVYHEFAGDEAIFHIVYHIDGKHNVTI